MFVAAVEVVRVTDVTTINYHRVGSGEPLLLTHGIGERWQYWLPVLPLLVDRYDIVALDLPGFGESPELAKPWTLVDLRVSLEALLDELGWATAHVSGISMGGYLALQLGAVGRARSVTALSPAGLLKPGLAARQAGITLDATYRGAALLAPIARRFGKYGAVRTLLQGTNMQHGSRIPASLIEGDLAAVRAPGWGVAREALKDCNVRETGKLGDIPLTVAFGDKDKILPPRGVDRSRLPLSTRWVSLTGCGHTPTYDDPAAVAATIEATAALA